MNNIVQILKRSGISITRDKIKALKSPKQLPLGIFYLAKTQFSCYNYNRILFGETYDKTRCML